MKKFKQYVEERCCGVESNEESVEMNESSNINKLKAAAKDFEENSKGKSRSYQSVADALDKVAFAANMLLKSTSGRTDYKYEGIVSREAGRVAGLVNSTYNTEEGKEIRNLLKKHGLYSKSGSPIRPITSLAMESVGVK